MKKFVLKLISAFLLIFSLSFSSSFAHFAYAEPTLEDETVTEESTDEATTSTENGEATTDASIDPNSCEGQTGALSWIVCPTSGVIAGAVDQLYLAIEDLLIVQPLPVSNALPTTTDTDTSTDTDSTSTDTTHPIVGTTMDTSPIYVVWQYARSLTNIVFIIFLLIVIYSQVTGLGLDNYGIKRTLPRLIIAVVIVNLSYIICALAVDLSNLIGSSLRDFFTGIELNIIANSSVGTGISQLGLDGILTATLAGGTLVTVAVQALGGGGYLFFMVLITIFGALIAVITGLITIAARQAVVSLLVMIAPLAFVAYLLPNTEQWFTKWRRLFIRMLVFYPAFSFLFSASHLLGYALLASASTPAGVILGIAVQIFPLFFSWSLMKMSDTILGSLNAAMRKMAAPLQTGFNRWSLGHAEQRRQNYIASSGTPGAHLRRYLDYRQQLRTIDTINSLKVREGQATERAYDVMSSSLGLDEHGIASYTRRANRYTTTSKRASIYSLRATTAELAHKNTLSRYGSLFANNNPAAMSLSSQANRSLEEAMTQNYLAANEAQADQDYLLEQHLKAAAAGRGSYEYNRLLGNTAGSLGHNGISSVLGQVIVANSTTENRRRAEGRIVFTKFPVDKKAFRAFLLDKARVNDNGFETDEYGNEIEDENYELLPGTQHTAWQHYFYRDKITGREINKSAYAKLSAHDQASYARIKYLHIKDDQGNVVQTVYDDDAGYMKELLNDDILIGDPINDRYNTLIGAGDELHDAGLLRRYHSTISAALNTSGYKTHDAMYTPMLTAQSNMGYINSVYHNRIAKLQSYNVATKAGNFLQNDGIVIERLNHILAAYNDDEAFAKYFPDKEIATYNNVNGFELKGLEWGKIKDDSGNEIGEGWLEVGFKKLAEMLDNGQEEEVVKLRKNYIRHSIIPKSIERTFSNINRNLSPNILESQKADALKALLSLADITTNLAEQNADPNTPLDRRLDPNKNFFSSVDPSALKQKVQHAIKNHNPDAAPATHTTKKSRKQLGGNFNNQTGIDPDNTDLSTILHALADQLGQYDGTHNPVNITEAIDEYSRYMTFDEMEQSVINLFQNTPHLTGFTDQAQNLINQYRFNIAHSSEEAIHNATHQADVEHEQMLALGRALNDLVASIPYD